MSRFLETHQLELTVKGPVFIGCGYEIQKKEYIFLNKNTLGVVDAGKLFQLAKQRHLEEDLERFMLEEWREDLKHWVIRNNITFRDIADCMKYQINAGDMEEEKGRKQIMSCISDPYGNPYIPGSSVKGMLRTILLCADIISRHNFFSKNITAIKQDLQKGNTYRTKVLANSTRQIESQVFHVLGRTDKYSDAVNDWMSGVIVSDSEPLSRKDIILCQKWERYVDGKEKALNIFRECVKPEAKIRCELTLDRKICKLSVQDIQNAIRLFYNIYYEVFQKKFEGEEKSSEYTVFLGGGSGFVSKTLIYALFGEKEGTYITKEIFEKTKVPKEHRHFLDTKIGVSPHILKCTRYKGKKYMMGECELCIY